MPRGAFKSIIRGLERACEKVAGKTVGPPLFTLFVRNPNSPGIDSTCLWQDDNHVFVEEDDGDEICIDDAQ